MELNTISAIKRNDRREMTALLFEAAGMTDAATEVRESTRITGALINRLCEPEVGDESSVEVEVDSEPSSSQETVAETMCDALETKAFPDICAALEAGKGKKAHKLCKKEKKNGASGSILTGLTRKAKEMK